MKYTVDITLVVTDQDTQKSKNVIEQALIEIRKDTSSSKFAWQRYYSEDEEWSDESHSGYNFDSEESAYQDFLDTMNVYHKKVVEADCQKYEKI